METPTLIYCAGGNPIFYRIARDAGFLYGARLPDTVYGPLFFADQEFKAPDRGTYMAALAEHRPVMASVLDLEREDQLSEVLSWAEEAAQYVERVMLIPKVAVIDRLPRQVGGADVILGYSVPTRYAGTELPIWMFAGWPVHLLGGSPHAQMRLAGYPLPYTGKGRGKYVTGTLQGVMAFERGQVASVDGNMHNLMATRWCIYWVPGTAHYARNRWWPTLAESADGDRWGDGSDKTDAPQEAFLRSCQNISETWKALR